MARGGFSRALKLADSLVTDHRPVGHPDADESWVEVTVPKDIPIAINEGIAAKLLSVVDGKLTWPADARDLHDAWLEAEMAKPRVSEVGELKALLVEKKILTTSDLEAGR